jgi:hypothetical protein
MSPIHTACGECDSLTFEMDKVSISDQNGVCAMAYSLSLHVEDVG